VVGALRSGAGAGLRRLAEPGLIDDALADAVWDEDDLHAMRARLATLRRDEVDVLPTST
jgi:hypothetical protein